MDGDNGKLAHGQCFGSGGAEDFGNGRIDKDFVVF